MTERRINLYTPNLPDPQRMAWMEANGIDPTLVPAAQEAIVTDTEISVIQFVRGEDGYLQLRPDAQSYEKQLITVPLISAPENHGL